MNPAVVSLKGYANVNRELLTSVHTYNIYYLFGFFLQLFFFNLCSVYLFQSITTIAIYLIVLLQFKISLIQQQSVTPMKGS